MRHILLAAAAMTLASCSNDIEPAGGDNGTPQPLRVTAQIGQPQSRVSGTAWNENDQIGIYCYKAGSPTGESTVYANMQYITTDGSGNFAHVGGEESGIFINDPQGYDITAIYPYSGNEGDDSSIRTISTADQSSRTDLDVLWASGSASNLAPAITMDFRHVMSRLILHVKAGAGMTVEALEQGAFTIDNVVPDTRFDISTGLHDITAASTGTLNVTTAPRTKAESAISYDMILVPGAFGRGATLQAKIGGITYRLSLTPEKLPLAEGTLSTLTVTVNASGMSLSNCTIEQWDSSTHSGEATIIPPIGNKPMSAVGIGDYYFSDGSFADKNAELTTEQAKACIGIVFHRGSYPDDGSDYSDSGINQQKCNGYVVALTDVGELEWSTKDFTATGVSTSDKDWNGYSNQKKLEERGIDNYPAAKGCKDYGTESGSRFAAPTGSSGWFLPSAGQLKHLHDNEANISGQMDKCRNRSGDSNIGWFSTDWYYWSSSEGSGDYAWDVSFRSGYVGSYNKRYTDDVRAVLAF